MLSMWWLLAAFLGGGWIGLLLFALMSMCRDVPRQSNQISTVPAYLTDMPLGRGQSAGIIE